MNFVTAPLIADLFLLAIQAIGRQEVLDGTLGANNILPYNIMIFFLSLAYIAISIDCSGLVRWLAFKVVERVQKQKGEQGKWLFFYLYVFFFVLGSFIGNDPIILSGTAFIAYMTRVSKNIIHPRAWIHTQFAVANIASAILVSSNPTNLVLAGAFGIKFIDYTANMIIPVLITAVALFPFLLLLIFKEQDLIPSKIEIHELGPREIDEKPANPNIPDGRGPVDERGDEELRKEVLNPYMDGKSAAFGAFIMSATLTTLLVINESDQDNDKDKPVFYITLPAAFVMFCWDLGWGWWKREETREIARKHLLKAEDLRAQQELERLEPSISIIVPEDEHSQNGRRATSTTSMQNEVQKLVCQPQQVVSTTSIEENEEKRPVSTEVPANWQRQKQEGKSRIVAHVRDAYKWSRVTFPTVTTVLSLLPYALLPFAFSMFVLVQGLVTKGWVAVFAYGWDCVRNPLSSFLPFNIFRFARPSTVPVSRYVSSTLSRTITLTPKLTVGDHDRIRWRYRRDGFRVCNSLQRKFSN
jgi:Na+/H+ antiporter NhaD/arsenite permease-like protein